MNPRLVVGITLLTAATAKGWDSVRFSRQLEILWGVFGRENSPTLEEFALSVAVILILVQFGLGAALVWNWRGRLTLRATRELMLASAVVAVIEMARGAEDCGCFGVWLRQPPVLALGESLALAGMAALALRTATDSPQKWKPTALTLGAGAAWVALNLANPQPGTAVRPGSRWELPTPEPTTEAHWVWLFDPECLRCLDRLGFFETIADTTRFYAVTKASKGRVAEFQNDFPASFAVRRVAPEVWRRWLLPTGTLIRVKAGRVSEVYLPGDERRLRGVRKGR